MSRITCYSTHCTCHFILCLPCNTYSYAGAVHVLYYATSHFGLGTGGILLENLACSGDEDMLINCSHSGIGVHTCRHHQDAGVACLGGTFSGSFLIMSI